MFTAEQFWLLRSNTASFHPVTALVLCIFGFIERLWFFTCCSSVGLGRRGPLVINRDCVLRSDRRLWCTVGVR
jgi:hypothetical protein